MDIPAHTQVGFGCKGAGPDVDYVTWTYSTGNIPLTVVTSPLTGRQYQVHRNATQYYVFHDPERGLPPTPNTKWNNTLTFNLLNGVTTDVEFTWAFAPNADITQAPPNNAPLAAGYACSGAAGGDRRDSIADTNPWTVWVR